MAKVAASEKRCFKPAGKKLKAGLDLGTAYIVIVVLDENDDPVACEKEGASVLRDGVVVDYQGALAVVRRLKGELERRLGTELDVYKRQVSMCAFYAPPSETNFGGGLLTLSLIHI